MLSRFYGVVFQRRHRHFKSGQATANKRSLMHVASAKRKAQAQILDMFQSVVSKTGKTGACGAIGLRIGLDSEAELLQAAECAISLAAARCTHLYLATRGCRCSPVWPRRAPDLLVKERNDYEKRVQAGRACVAHLAQIVSSSDCLCSLKTRPMTH